MTIPPVDSPTIETEIRALTIAVNRLVDSRRSLWFAIAAVLAILLLAGSYLFYSTNRQSGLLDCFSRYTDQAYARSLFLQQYLIPRNEAQNSFEISVADKQPEAVINVKRNAFIKAANAYTQALQNNPLPQPPRLTCSTSPKNAVVPTPSR